MIPDVLRLLHNHSKFVDYDDNDFDETSDIVFASDVKASNVGKAAVGVGNVDDAQWSGKFLSGASKGKSFGLIFFAQCLVSLTSS